ncbi:MAG: hypothetical protein EBR09_14780 [Proteobacteria bacterium]|nr:hypothetical protein [Pseudomonadota bacterium]
MRFLKYGILFLLPNCVPAKKPPSNAEAQAIKRYETDSEFIVVAQKPDDMRIVEIGNSMVRFKTSAGRTGQVSLVRNGDYNFIAVREALADGFQAKLKDKSMRDVFLIPKINGRPDKTINQAKSEKWNIEKIVSTSESFAEAKGIKIYCPVRIEFRKKDGKRHVSEFPVRSNCETDINDYLGDIDYYN